MGDVLTPMQRAALAGLELLAAQGKLDRNGRIGLSNLIKRLEIVRRDASPLWLKKISD